MIPALKDLRIVELSRLILHEAHEPTRLAPIREDIGDEGVQRNPAVVAPYGDRCLLLDGAYRARVLRELGCRFALVQLVEPPEMAGSGGHLLGARNAGLVKFVEEAWEHNRVRYYREPVVLFE